MSRADGFSMVEMLIAMTIVLTVAGATVTLFTPSQGLAASRAETADMQQRLRVAADALQQYLAVAGAGAYADGMLTPLVNTLPPILPYRFGGTAADPPGTFKADTITLLSTPRNAALPAGTTFWLKSNHATDTYQLMMNDTTSSLDVPVVDHVVALAFDYFGDPRPPLALAPPADVTGPWTTYGPKPAASAVAPFAAGENCVFVNAGGPLPQPRLAELSATGDSLVPLTPAQLSDGPWCPNDMDVNRWDADLLRIRSVAVVIRVEASTSTLRGPASVLFTHGGSSRSADRWVPDQEVRLQMSPPNLNAGR